MRTTAEGFDADRIAGQLDTGAFTPTVAPRQSPLTAPQSLQFSRFDPRGAIPANQQELDAYIAQTNALAQASPEGHQFFGGPTNYNEYIQSLPFGLDIGHLQENNPSYHGKYSNLVPVPGQENLFRATLQQPGAHRRDTMEAFYALDPATGQAQLVGDPQASRQPSGWKNFVKEDLPGILSVLAPMAVPALAAPGMLGSNAAAAAAYGAGSSALTGGNTRDILRAGLVGGVAGGIADYLGPQAPDINSMSDAAFEAYLDSIAPIGNSAGSVGSAVQTPVNIAESIPVTGSAMPPVSTGAIAGSISSLPSAINPTQTVEIAGNRESPPAMTFPVAPPAAITSTPLEPPVNPGETIEITGSRDSPSATVLPAAPSLSTGSAPQETYPRGSESSDFLEVNDPPGAGDRSLGSKFADWAKANPVQALQVLSGIGGLIGGGLGGSSGGGGGAPSTGQEGMTAQQAPKFQRQYVAPPPGYRPGFDPEHTYFTGIGSVGTGG
jgi:hypothetical protein